MSLNADCVCIEMACYEVSSSPVSVVNPLKLSITYRQYLELRKYVLVAITKCDFVLLLKMHHLPIMPANGIAWSEGPCDFQGWWDEPLLELCKYDFSVSPQVRSVLFVCFMKKREKYSP